MERCSPPLQTPGRPPVPGGGGDGGRSPFRSSPPRPHTRVAQGRWSARPRPCSGSVTRNSQPRRLRNSVEKVFFGRRGETKGSPIDNRVFANVGLKRMVISIGEQNKELNPSPPGLSVVLFSPLTQGSVARSMALSSPGSGRRVCAEGTLLAGTHCQAQKQVL